MVSPPRGIVTPEGVVLEFETAGIASRGLARGIDALIQGAALLAVVLLVGWLFDGSGATGIVVIVAGIAAIVLGYPILCEVASRGRSPGKAVFGLRVVTTDGAPETSRQAFIRSVLGIVDFLIPPGGLVAVLVALPSPTNQRLGDLVAGTIVLRERTAAPPAAPVWFPPPGGLEAYTASLDVSGVSPSQLALVRSFLLRVPDLSPEARGSLGVRLSSALASSMHHQPPPGVHGEPFLVAVVSAHQRRHHPAPPPPPPVAAPPPPPPLPPPPPPTAS